MFFFFIFINLNIWFQVAFSRFSAQFLLFYFTTTITLYNHIFTYNYLTYIIGTLILNWFSMQNFWTTTTQWDSPDVTWALPLHTETLPYCNTAKSCSCKIQGCSNIKCIYSTRNLQQTQPSRLPWCGRWDHRPAVITFLIIVPPTCLLRILHFTSPWIRQAKMVQGPHRYECVCMCARKVRPFEWR